MSIDYTNISALIIPEGEVIKIEDSTGVTIWEKKTVTYYPILENNSWEAIAAASKEGLASSLWNVGDQKKITIEGNDYFVDIIGFDHDTPSDVAAYGRDRVGITFQLHGVYNQNYTLDDGNNLSWPDTVMARSYLPGIRGRLETALQNVIVPVEKVYNIDGDTSSSNLFILSINEAIQQSVIESYSIPNICRYGDLYQYYIDDYTRANKDRIWWTRSINTSGKYGYVIASSSEPYPTGRDLTNSAGVSFAFCV